MDEKDKLEELKNNSEEAAEKAESAAEAAKDAVAETAETAADVAEDAVAETAESAAEAAEDAVAETAESAADAAEDAAEGGDITGTENSEADKEDAPIEVDNRQNMPRFSLAAMLAVAVVVVAGVLVLSLVLINAHKFRGGRYPSSSFALTDYPYSDATYDYDEIEKDYLDIYSMTSEEYADRMGMTYEEYLMYFRLPKDLPRNLNSNAADALMPIGRFSELRNTTLDAVREDMGWDESVKEGDPRGPLMDNTPVKYVFGEDVVEEFKAYIGAGDEVTGDTLYKDVRPLYEQKIKERYDLVNATQPPTEAPEKADKADESAAADEGAADESAADEGAAEAKE